METRDDVPGKRSSTMDLLFSKMEFLEQYARTVVDYTSKYNNLNSISYAPENLSGRPNKYPHYGDFPDTYMLRSYGRWWNESESAQRNYMPQDGDDIVSEDYIVLSFESAVIPLNVVIYETYNPGAVVRLYGRLSLHPWHLLYEGPPQVCPPTSRKFVPQIRQVYDIINEVRIEFNQSHLKYHTSLDAVLLVGYKPNSTLQVELLRRGFLGRPSTEERRPEIAFEIDDEKDYFSLLPYEVIVHIFQYLDLKSISRCAQVNKRWYAATLDSAIYQSLSLKKYWTRVDDGTLKYFRKRCKTLKKLDLSWCGDRHWISEDVFQNFLNKCGTQLTHLSLCNCQFVQNVAMGTIRKCAELVDLRLRNVCPAMWTFTFLAELNKLVSLDLYGTFLEDDALIRILQANRHLKHLVLDYCENLECMDQVTETISIFNSKLVTFSCWKTRSLTANGVKHLSRCYNLRELDMGWCLILNDPEDCLERIAQGCKDLRRLILSNWRGLNDHLLLPIIRSCKHLEQLDLLGIKNITGDICECALASLPLRLLEISFCDSIRNEQVEVWRETYPEVVIQKNSETTVSDYFDYFN